MIGKSSSLCAKIMHAIFMLIEDVGLSEAVRFPPFLGTFASLLDLLFALQRWGTRKQISPFPVYVPLSTYRLPDSIIGVGGRSQCLIFQLL